MNSEVKCPFMLGATTTPVTGTQNKDWWPNQLNLDILRQHDTKSNPVAEVDYKEEVKKLDVGAVKAEVKKVMRDSRITFLTSALTAPTSSFLTSSL